MENKTTWRRASLLAFIALALHAQQQDRPVPPPGVTVSDADRKELEAGIAKLSDAIKALGKNALLSDVQVFRDAVRVALYRQHYNPNGVPDRLEKVTGVIEGKTTQVENQTFWVDFWVDANAPVQRIKIELQLWVGDRWVLYPMEARIVDARVPSFQPKFSVLPAPEARADLAMISPWRDYLCRPIASEFTPSETNIRLLQQRNVQQDVALARQKGRDFVLSAFVRAGIPAEQAMASKWCELPVEQWRGELGTEWYMRVRDALLR